MDPFKPHRKGREDRCVSQGPGGFMGWDSQEFLGGKTESQGQFNLPDNYN